MADDFNPYNSTRRNRSTSDVVNNTQTEDKKVSLLETLVKNSDEQTKSLRTSKKKQQTQEDKLSNLLAKMYPTMGGLLKSIREYNQINKAGSVDLGGNSGALNNAKAGIVMAVTKGLQKATDYMIKQWSDYAKAFEKNLTSTATNLGITRGEYSKMAQEATKNLFQNGMVAAVSSKQVLDAMNTLTQKGIASNLNNLGSLLSVSSKVSTTWSSDKALEAMRLFGSNSDAMKLSLGSEAMLTNVLQEQFGDSQFVMNGMYTSLQKSLQTVMRVANSVEEGNALQYNIAKNVGAMYEAGYSEETIGNIESDMEAISKGQLSKVSTAGLLAMSKSGGIGAFSGGLNSANSQAFLSAYNGLTSQYQTGNVWKAGALSEATGIGVSDLIKGTTAVLDETTTTADTIVSYADQQIKEAKDRQTFYENIQNIKDNLVAYLGGNSLGVLGSGTLDAGGKLISGALGLGGTLLAGKMMGAGGSGGLLKGLLGLGGSGGTSAASAAGGAGLGALGTALGIGGTVVALGQGVSAVKNKTYGNSGIGNFLGGAIMGNQSGDTSGMGWLKSIGGNAAKGAAIGAFGGPVGAAIGAVVGGIAGGIGNAIAAKKNEQTSTEQQVAEATTSSSDASANTDALNALNSSINLQGDRIVASLTNIYRLIDDRVNDRVNSYFATSNN